jgi:hypothetical protein
VRERAEAAEVAEGDFMPKTTTVVVQAAAVL